MECPMTRPMLVSIALDRQTPEVVAAAVALARRSKAPLGAVHSIGWRPFESEEGVQARTATARAAIDDLLAPARAAGVEVLETRIEAVRPGELVPEAGSEMSAQMLITGGGGGGDSVRRWLVGSVAEGIVRGSNLPVFIARGGLPGAGGKPVLCPLDLSAHSLEGLQAALGMARLFGAPLVTLTVLPKAAAARGAEPVDKELPRDEPTARDRLAVFLESVDLQGVEVEHRLFSSDDAVSAIVEASADASLLVMATRNFADIGPSAMGAFTERVMQLARCSTLIQRVSHVEDDSDSAQMRRLGSIRARAEAHLAAGRAEQAVPLYELLARRASGNAAVHERLAEALEACGRDDEAACRRRFAALVREQLG